MQQNKAGNPCGAACSHCAGNARTQKLLELFQMCQLKIAENSSTNRRKNMTIRMYAEQTNT